MLVLVSSVIKMAEKSLANPFNFCGEDPRSKVQPHHHYERYCSCSPCPSMTCIAACIYIKFHSNNIIIIYKLNSSFNHA